MLEHRLANQKVLKENVLDQSEIIETRAAEP